MEKIKLTEKMCYGFGDLACNLLFQLVGAYLMFFYTDVAGISLGAVTLIMLVARIVDAVTDPMMGMVIDKTHSKYGKARPYLLWSAVPFAVISVLMFTIPNIGQSGKAVYAMITYVLFCVAYTALNVPYTTMMSSMTDHPSDRLGFNLFKTLGGNIGSFLAMGLTLTLVAKIGGGSQVKGFVGTVTIFVAAGLVLLFFCFKNTKERIVPPQDMLGLKKSLSVALKNKPWILVCLIAFLTFTNMILKNQSTTYFAKYYLQKEGIAALLMTLPNIIAFPVAFLVPVLAKKLGKRNCVISGNLMMILGFAGTWIAEKNVPALLMFNIMGAIGVGVAMGVAFVMAAETIDYSEWQTGLRPQGIMTALVGFMVKLGMAAAGVIGAQVMKFGGYIENADQSASAILAIRLNYIGIPALIAGLAIVAALFYDLDKKYDNIMEEVYERRKRTEKQSDKNTDYKM